MLTNKTILITGATSGFGRACAVLFAKHGAKLVLVGRRSERLLEMQQQLAPCAVNIQVVDVRDNRAVQRMVRELPKEFSNVDVLINNAGLARGILPAQEALLDDWEEMVNTNIKGLMYCTHAVLPGMVARNSGHIINIGSIAGNYPYKGGNVYGASKAFVLQFSQNLRTDLLGKNVRVTNLEPGMAETEFSMVRFHGDREKAHNVYQGIDPLTADDVAETALWCVTRPAHVNINRIELMPVQQAAGGLLVSRI